MKRQSTHLNSIEKALKILLILAAHDKEPVAAVVITMPDRVRHHGQLKLASHLKKTAKKISKKLTRYRI